MNFNLKGKAETSGYPHYCTNDYLKEKYIAEYFDKEGIQLYKEKIVENPGARADFKRKLNSLWGFFALNCDKTMFKILKSLGGTLTGYVVESLNSLTQVYLPYRCSNKFCWCSRPP